MALHPGDEKHEHSSYVSYPDDGTAAVGEPVELDGSGNITALTEGGSALGVLWEKGEAGNPESTVKTSGVVVARVDGAVTEGTYLGSPNTSATDPEEGPGAFGTFDNQHVLALEDADGTYDDTSDSHALVLIK